MAAEKFSSEMNNRGTVKVTDKLMIQNIDTGAVEYTTVSKLLQALSISVMLDLEQQILLVIMHQQIILWLQV